MDVEGPSAWTLVPMVRMLRLCAITSRGLWGQNVSTGEGCGDARKARRACGPCPHSPL